MDRAFYKALAIGGLFFFAACSKEEPMPAKPPVTAEQKVFIVCEGSMGNGNSQLDLYLPEQDSIYENVYHSINGHSLGDVFQSMQQVGDNYFLCVNNSDKIAAVNRNDLKLAYNINIPKPRYIHKAGENKFYVSSLFQNKLYVIDAGGSQKGAIELKGNSTEGMLSYQDKTFVCTWDTSVNYVYVIKTATDQVIDSYTITGYAPQEVLLDRENKLWVLSGNITKGRRAALTRIDPLTGQQLMTYIFPDGAEVVRPVMNKEKDSIYFIEVNYSGGTANNGVYRMSVHDNELPQQPFVAALPFQYFWALGIDPNTGFIYLGNPKGFIQKGSVCIYRQDGSLVREFKCGVGPGHFYFD